MTETWKDVAGYEGLYQVSNLGRVRSLDRVVPDSRGWTRKIKGRILKTQNTGNNKYWMLILSKEGIHETFTVHKLVASAFLGPCPKGMEILHGVEGKEVNTPSNLRYGTRSENAFDRLRDGTQSNRPVRRSDGRDFTSPSEAHRLTGIQASSIRAVCSKYISPNGKRRLTAGGFSWEFI
jgi:hypothetical protein